jgi:hypothetical protein
MSNQYASGGIFILTTSTTDISSSKFYNISGFYAGAGIGDIEDSVVSITGCEFN